MFSTHWHGGPTLPVPCCLPNWSPVPTLWSFHFHRVPTTVVPLSNTLAHCSSRPQCTSQLHSLLHIDIISLTYTNTHSLSHTNTAARAKLRKLVADAAAGGGTGEKSPHAKAEYSAEEFEELSQKYEKLNWRMISRPGGATTKPDDFYRLYALHMQVSNSVTQCHLP